MDQSTQQNAAMVEQSTAAASSLPQEASSLKELASRFKIDKAGRMALRAACPPRGLETALSLGIG